MQIAKIIPLSNLGTPLGWSDLILSGVVWSGHKGIQPLGRLGDWLDQTAEGIDWSGIFFTYGFDHLDTSVKNHFLVYKAIFAWSQTPNEQLTNQPGEPRASLLLTSVSEKAVFCNYDLSTAIVCINYSYWCVNMAENMGKSIRCVSAGSLGYIVLARWQYKKRNPKKYFLPCIIAFRGTS